MICTERTPGTFVNLPIKLNRLSAVGKLTMYSVRYQAYLCMGSPLPRADPDLTTKLARCKAYLIPILHRLLSLAFACCNHSTARYLVTTCLAVRWSEKALLKEAGNGRKSIGRWEDPQQAAVAEPPFG